MYSTCQKSVRKVSNGMEITFEVLHGTRILLLEVHNRASQRFCRPMIPPRTKLFGQSSLCGPSNRPCNKVK